MIKVLVDEAYAFDMLSILEVKWQEKSDKLNEDNFYKFSENLLFELNNFDFLLKILHSKEYKKLKEVNYQIFIRINEIKKREIHASDAIFIDDLNYQRYLAKKALQETFFPKNKLTEQKIGYDK